MSTNTIRLASLLIVIATIVFGDANANADLRAGAAAIDITPVQFPVLVNGGMFSRSTEHISTRLHARAIVLEDNGNRIAMVVVDSCLLPSWLLDEAKQRAAQRTQIDVDRIMISVTHTHTAPSAFACLGTDVDPSYPAYLREKLAEAIATAEANLEPARVGWAVTQAPELTALRRWILRSDRIQPDPFGNMTVRANMHVAANLENVTGPSGPEDPDLALIVLQSRAGNPIAVLANFSMHYFGGQKGLSADYFGLFCDQFSKQIAPDPNGDSSLVVMMSHGCSGDIWRRDYARPDHPINEIDVQTYAARMSAAATRAYNSVKFSAQSGLEMQERRFDLGFRLPDQQRQSWSEGVVQQIGDGVPKTREQVYAREQLILNQERSTEVVLQTIRIGDIAVAATPTETYALTGLKIKRQSPVERTMVIELANGACGYIPPPEQHRLGGYNTWAARSAGLEVYAEPKIVAGLLELLEAVCHQPRQHPRQSQGAAVTAILDEKPIAYWRLDELSGPNAVDSSGNHHAAFYEPTVAFYLDGPAPSSFCLDEEMNRSVHFVGGRLRARIPDLKDQYSVALWCWNGMPNGSREMAGWLMSRGHNFGADPYALGVDGSADRASYLKFDGKSGHTPVVRWQWHQVVFVRDGNRVRIFLDGEHQHSLDAQISRAFNAQSEWFFGGRSDHEDGWEGRLDEIAIFDRALSPAEVEKLYPLHER